MPQPKAVEILTAWFLRLWFLAQIDPSIPGAILRYSEQADSPYTFFQAIRILFERGFHEPSPRQRQIAQSIAGPLTYIGASLESTDWWESTISNDGSSYVFDQALTLIQLACTAEIDQIKSLFPQLKPSDFEPQTCLVSGDRNAIRAKLFLLASSAPKPYPNLLLSTQYDASLTLHTANLPPEDCHREYKATFRWDSEHSQKNKHQQSACLKAICGFLNADGGTLIIGVDNSLKVIGLEGDLSLIRDQNPHDALLQVFQEAVKQSISPVPIGLVTPTIQPYGDHAILVVNVKNGESRYLLSEKGEDPAYYVRDGNRTLRIKG